MKKIVFVIVGLIIVISIAIVVFAKLNTYSGELVGIEGTKTYHRDNCQFVKKTSMNNLVFFKDLKQTAEYDFRACKTCNPPNNKKIIEEIEKEKQAAIEEQKKYDMSNNPDWARRCREIASQYLQDMKDGKITGGVSDYDADRIRNGLNPLGKYINKEDEPEGFNKLRSEEAKYKPYTIEDLRKEKYGED